MPRDWLDGAGAKKRRERSFFYAILITLAPSYAEELVKDCWRQRVAALQGKVNKPSVLQISSEWIGPLLEQPFLPCKFISYLLSLVFHQLALILQLSLLASWSTAASTSVRVGMQSAYVSAITKLMKKDSYPILIKMQIIQLILIFCPYSSHSWERIRHDRTCSASAA